MLALCLRAECKRTSYTCCIAYVGKLFLLKEAPCLNKQTMACV